MSYHIYCIPSEEQRLGHYKYFTLCGNCAPSATHIPPSILVKGHIFSNRIDVLLNSPLHNRSQEAGTKEGKRPHEAWSSDIFWVLGGLFVDTSESTSAWFGAFHGYHPKAANIVRSRLVTQGANSASRISNSSGRWNLRISLAKLLRSVCKLLSCKK